MVQKNDKPSVNDRKPSTPTTDVTATGVDVDALVVQIHLLITSLMASHLNALNNSATDAAPQPTADEDEYFDMFDALDGRSQHGHGAGSQPGAAASVVTSEGAVETATTEPAGTGVGKDRVAATSCGEGSSSASASVATGSNSISGFVCASCNAYNLIRPARDTWYAIFAGRRVGVFQGWAEVQPLVSGVRNACFRRYNSREEAQTAYDTAVADGNVRVITN